MPVGNNTVLDTYNFAKSVAVILSVLAPIKKCSGKKLNKKHGQVLFSPQIRKEG